MILAIDQGTTGTTCLALDDDLRVTGRGYRELPQHFPRPGWVEHDPDEIWATVTESAREASGDPTVVAITNQRETTLLWDRATGKAVAPAIVWQDRRTADRCRELDAELIRRKTGLVPDPYFSATKLEWLLREHGSSEGLAFGTVDSFLVWRLTGGEQHVIDVTNASRTLLVDLETLDWDDELLALFGISRELLPRIVGSADSVGQGELNGRTVEIRGIAGDQQAALYGQGCHAPGEGKATYGTGSFVLVHTGDDASAPPDGLLKTAAADGYALEGAVLTSGAAIQWLRDGLGLVGSAAETEALATSVDDTAGVHFVPALTGLGSPWWDADARGLVTGLTRGTTTAHLVRAALEAIAHQVADVVEALPRAPRVLRADGGATANGFLMQFQADLLQSPVEVAAERETTALGAAALAAGRESGVAVGAVYEPRRSVDEVAALRAGWRFALGLTRSS
ncbi:MAG TPA: glycerol kinase GlpK [Gaiellaceae bacterium]|nr:glycerol kinase GlpK [Gaiellaceae bacterium]